MFVLAYDNTAGNDQVSIDSYKKYFLPRVKIENCNIEIDGKNFYDQSINDSIKQYDEIITRVIIYLFYLFILIINLLIIYFLNNQKN